jgi:polyisoprenoid-binding protein YceI
MSKILLYLLFLISIITLSVNAQDVNTYTITPQNSKITFKAKHLRVLNVTGVFNKFRGEIQLSNNVIIYGALTLESGSISTNNDSRDKSLKAEEFIDAINYPYITLQFQNNKHPVLISPTLRIKTVVHPIAIHYKVTSIDLEKKKIEVTAQFNRSQFSLNLGSLDDLVSDKIEVSAQVILKVLE